MKLYLAQHGLSARQDGGEKRLTKTGQQQTSLIASVARNYSISPDAIVHSGKIRARQTAQIFQDTLHPAREMRNIDGIGPLDDVADFCNRLHTLENHLIVGHLPFLDRLLSLLVCGNQDSGVYRFQNSALICCEVEQAPDGRWNGQILWMLNPRVR